MALFEALVVLMLVALPLLAAAHRFGLPYPTLLVGAGALLAALPSAPRIDVDPKLALVLFVAPALLKAAYEASPRELYRHRLPLFMLAVMAVLTTTAAVAALGCLAAGLPVAAAVALGATVAPPDAAASGAVLDAVGLPRRAQFLLEGESLLNDASSLLVYGFAVSLAVPEQAEGGSFELLIAVPGGVLLGLAAAWAWVRAAALFERSLGFSLADILITFGVWLLADASHVSPVLAVVAFGLLLARHFTRRQSARDRVQSTAVWRALVLASNATAFLLVGLQARGILEAMDAAERVRASAFAGAVLVAVVVARLAWIAAGRLALGALHRLGRRWAPEPVPWPVALAMSWAGMRGVVTLAAAFSLPDAMPQRGLITLSAYGVVFGTLVLQGVTLGPLIRWLRIGGGGADLGEVAALRRRLVDRALATIAGRAGDEAASMRVRLRQIAEVAAGRADPQDASELDRLELCAIGDQRTFLHGLRAEGGVTEDAYRRLLEELDWAELHFRSFKDNSLA